MVDECDGGYDIPLSEPKKKINYRNVNENKHRK